MKKSNLINLKPEQRNSLLIKLIDKIENPGNRHTLQPDANKYPILAYILQDSIIEEKITELIYNN